jgi:hypothetical protein
MIHIGVSLSMTSEKLNLTLNGICCTLRLLNQEKTNNACMTKLKLDDYHTNKIATRQLLALCIHSQNTSWHHNS